MKVPLPKQSFAYNILSKYPTISHPINVYFGTGSRLFPIIFTPKYNYIPVIKFSWNHGVIQNTDICSTKFLTNVFFQSKSSNNLTEEIIYSIPNHSKDSNIHNIKYTMTDNFENKLIFKIEKKNLLINEIENNLFSEVIKCNILNDINLVLDFVEIKN